MVPLDACGFGEAEEISERVGLVVGLSELEAVPCPFWRRRIRIRGFSLVCGRSAFCSLLILHTGYSVLGMGWVLSYRRVCSETRSPEMKLLCLGSSITTHGSSHGSIPLSSPFSCSDSSVAEFIRRENKLESEEMEPPYDTGGRI